MCASVEIMCARRLSASATKNIKVEAAVQSQITTRMYNPPELQKTHLLKKGLHLKSQSAIAAGQPGPVSHEVPRAEGNV